MASLGATLVRFALLVQLMIAFIVINSPVTTAVSTRCAFDCFIAKSSAAGCDALSSFQDSMDCWCNDNPIGDVADCGHACEIQGAWLRSFASVCNSRRPDNYPDTRADAISPFSPGNAIGDERLDLAREAREKRQLAVRNAEAEPTFKPISCTAPGITCGAGEKRNIHIVADPEVVAEIEAGLSSERDASPEADAKFKPTSCTVPGITCGQDEKRAAVPEAAAEPVPDPKFTPTSCTVPGITCGQIEKRDAEAAPKPAPVPEPKFTPTSCTVPGITCGQIEKRDAVPEATPEPNPEPHAVADAGTQDTSKFEPTSCTVPGITCGIEVPTGDDNAPITTLKKVVRSTTEPANVGTTALAKIARQDESFDISKWLTLSYPTTTYTQHLPTGACTAPGITCGIAVNDLDSDADEIRGDYSPAADDGHINPSSAVSSSSMEEASSATVASSMIIVSSSTLALSASSSTAISSATFDSRK